MSKNQMRLAAEEADMAAKPGHVLSVDDEEANRDILQRHLTKAGYKVTSASSGSEAWQRLRNAPQDFDLVLLDRMMPGMDGIEVLKRIKSDPMFQTLPVILQTATGGEENIADGIEAGAYYYVTKPYSARMLLSVVQAALHEKRQGDMLRHSVQRRESVLALLRHAHYEFGTLREARELAIHLAGFAPEPSKAIISLTALAVNAVEHGNLGIGYERKAQLLTEDGLEQEIEYRLSQPEYERRRARVVFARGPGEIKIRISDQGEGFDWQSYLEFDPARMRDPNGRGIAMARAASPGAISYRGKGNEVLYVMKLESKKQEI